MRQVISISTLLLMCSLVVSPSMVLAQSDQGTATAVVGVALTVTNQTDLDFGAFTTGATGGTVFIDAGDPSGAANGVTGDVTETSPGARGTMLVNGNANANIFANLTSSAINLNCTEGGCLGSSMSASLTLDTPTQTDATGAATIGVGGTLTVSDASTNPEGSYAGTYEVNVNY